MEFIVPIYIGISDAAIMSEQTPNAIIKRSTMHWSSPNRENPQCLRM